MVGYLVCLGMVVWILMLYSLNSLALFVVKKLTVANFYSNADTHTTSITRGKVWLELLIWISIHLYFLVLIGDLSSVVVR